MCLWGCATKAVYSARFDFEKLRLHASISYREGFRVLRIEREGTAYRAVCRGPDGKITSFASTKIILAAGALMSTALALDCADYGDRSIPIGTTPAFAFAVLIPGAIGRAPVDASYAMAQLAWSVGEGSDRICGALYATDGIPATEIIKRLPLSRRGAGDFARWALPALLLGNGFLPSEYGACHARVHATKARPNSP